MSRTVNPPPRAFIYLRQSLDRTGTGAAVDRQRADCIKLCKERGWTAQQVFVDNDVSASARKPRPEYRRMFAELEAGKAEVVVAWHVDRLTRRLTELEELIELATRTSVRIATVTGDVDLSTDAGRLVGRILASVARGEVERKGARQRRAMEQAAEEGRPTGGRRPFGYAANGVDVVENEADLVREAYGRIITGGSLSAIAKDWNEQRVWTTAGNPWTHSTVRRVLQNPRYAGIRTLRGERIGAAIWEPLVDEEVHDTVAAILAAPERRTTKSTARKYLLPGIALCWKCGSDVATGHSRRGKRLYVCRSKKCISRKADPVDETIEGVAIERLSRPDATNLLDTGSRAELNAMRGRRQNIRDRLDDLAVGLEEGLLSLQAVRKSSRRLRDELAKIDAELGNVSETDVLRPLIAAEDVGAAWSALDLQQKRIAIDALMTITLLKPERGHQPFEPEKHLRIRWKGQQP